MATSQKQPGTTRACATTATADPALAVEIVPAASAVPQTSPSPDGSPLGVDGSNGPSMGVQARVEDESGTDVPTSGTSVVPRFPGAASWYSLQWERGGLSADDLPPLLAAAVSKHREATAAVEGSGRRLPESMLRPSVELLQFANENQVARDSLRSFVAEGGHTAKVVMSWAAAVGQSVGRWAEAMEVVLGRSVDHDAASQAVKATAAACVELLRLGRVSPSQVDGLMPPHRQLRLINGTATRELPAPMAAALLEHLRNLSARRFVSGAGAAAPQLSNGRLGNASTAATYGCDLQPHQRRFAAVCASLLQHSADPTAAAEARGHRAYLLPNDFATALVEWLTIPAVKVAFGSAAAVAGRGTHADVAHKAASGEVASASPVPGILSRPACLCAVLSGQGLIASSAFRAGPATHQAFADLTAAAHAAVSQSIASSGVVSSALHAIRTSAGFRVVPPMPALPATGWEAALRQYLRSCRLADAVAAVPGPPACAGAGTTEHRPTATAAAAAAAADPLTHFDSAIAAMAAQTGGLAGAGSNLWMQSLALLTSQHKARGSRALAVQLVSEGAWEAAAACHRGEAASQLWLAGNVDAATAVVPPRDIPAAFASWMNDAPSSVAQWHAALALTAAAVAGAVEPSELMVVRTLKAFASPDAPAAAVDVLVQLRRPKPTPPAAKNNQNTPVPNRRSSEDNANAESSNVLELLLRAARLSGGHGGTGNGIKWTRMRSNEEAARSLATVARRIAASHKQPAALRAAFDAAVGSGEWRMAMDMLDTELLPAGVRPYPATAQRLADTLAEVGHAEAAGSVVDRLSAASSRQLLGFGDAAPFSAAELGSTPSTTFVSDGGLAPDETLQEQYTAQKLSDNVRRALTGAITSRRWSAALGFASQLCRGPAIHAPSSQALDDVLRLCAHSGTWFGTCAAFGLARSQAEQGVGGVAQRVAKENPALVVRSLVPLAREGRWFEAFTLVAAVAPVVNKTKNSSVSNGSKRPPAGTISSMSSGDLFDKCLGLAAKACRVDSNWRGALRTFDALAHHEGASFTALSEVVAACMGAGFPLARVQLWLRFGGKGGNATAPSVHNSERSVSLSTTSWGTETVSTATGMAVAFAVLAAQSRLPAAEAADAWSEATALFCGAAQDPERSALLSPECASSVMDTCTRAGRWERCFDVLRAMDEARPAPIPPSRHALHMLMGCWRLGRWQESVALFQRAVAGDAVDGLLRDRVLEALCSAGRWGDALGLALRQNHGSDHGWSRIALCRGVPAALAAKALLRLSLFPVSARHRLGARALEVAGQLEGSGSAEDAKVAKTLRRLVKDG